MRSMLIGIIASAGLLAGCQADGTAASADASARTQTVQQVDARAPFVGTWRGQVRDGSVEVVVPPRGEAFYRYQGRRVRTAGTVVRGNTLRLPFARGGGVSLTLEGSTMVYRYDGREGRARTVVTRI